MQVSELLGGGRGWLTGNQSFPPGGDLPEANGSTGQECRSTDRGDAVFSTLALA